MTINERLDEHTRAKLDVLVAGGINGHLNIETSHKQFKGHLTRREVEELMGTNRQTYKRVNGKVKRK